MSYILYSFIWSARQIVLTDQICQFQLICLCLVGDHSTMKRLTILVGRLKKSMAPSKYFFKVHLVGRFVPLVSVISRPVESPLQTQPFLKFLNATHGLGTCDRGLTSNNMGYSLFLNSTCDIGGNKRQGHATLPFLEIDLPHWSAPSSAPIEGE